MQLFGGGIAAAVFGGVRQAVRPAVLYRHMIVKQVNHLKKLRGIYTIGTHKTSLLI